MKARAVILITILAVALTGAPAEESSNEWASFWSDSTGIGIKPIPPGVVINAYDPDGVLCGSDTASTEGAYGLMAVYRDDPTTGEVDEGAEPGDTIRFRINGVPALPKGPEPPVWTSNGDVIKLHLWVPESVPVCMAKPASVDFDTVQINHSKSETFKLFNIGGDTLRGNITEDCLDFSITAGGGSFELPAGDSLNVEVDFSPSALGPYQCTVETGIDCCRVSCSGVSVEETAVLLLSYGSSWCADHVRIRWLMNPSLRDMDLTFRLLRRGSSEYTFRTVKNPVFERRRDSFTCRDYEAVSGKPYTYRVEIYHENSMISSFETEVETPRSRICLRQNRPNPFNPSTDIPFYLPEDAFVTLRIFDTSGRCIRNMSAGPMGAGSHTEVWDGKADDGTPAPSGVYFYRLNALKESISRKMVLMR